jgi:hypothetical protein
LAKRDFPAPVSPIRRIVIGQGLVEDGKVRDGGVRDGGVRDGDIDALPPIHGAPWKVSRKDPYKDIQGNEVTGDASVNSIL